MDSPGSTLTFQDVVVEYRRRRLPAVRAVAGVTLTVRKGQVHGLVGESGCGKSTLARTATGLLPMTSGSIVFDGEQVTPLSRRARPVHFRRLQMVFQDPYASLNPRRSVGDQLMDALRRSPSTSPPDPESRINDVLETVGLPRNAIKKLPREFSGGQRQRISIARALLADPSVIIADEPISALDASAQAQIANLLFDLSREFHLGILLISHDLGIIRKVSDVVTVMYLGKVVEYASPRELWDMPLHPYSEALIAAVPRPDGRGVLPQALPGEIHDPAQPPGGCRFHPRCSQSFGKCSTSEPPLFVLSSQRASACWLRDRD